MSGSDARGGAARIASMPVLRTFESRRFRLLVATILVLFGVAWNLLRLSMFESSESWGLDFGAYYHAAERMLAGSSPYATMQVASPAVAYCFDCYLYPPFFAQSLAPMTLVPLEAAKVIWLAIGYAAVFASTWLATGIGGATKSLERAIWCLAAVLLFEPVSHAVWNGNIGTIVALGVTAVAMGGTRAGVGAGVISLLKVAPGTLLPAVLASSRESRRALLVTLTAITGTLFLLAPRAWLEYPLVLANLFTDPARSDGDLALGYAVSEAGWGPVAVAIVRVATLIAAGVCILASIWVARRQGGMPAAALLGTVAMLIIPGTLWLHYLVVLLPFAAMAWPRARTGIRGVLLASLVLVSIAPYLDNPPLWVYLGASLSLTAAGWVLWPRQADNEVTGLHVSLGDGQRKPGLSL